MFFIVCPFALVFLQTIFEADFEGAAYAIVEKLAEKITKVAVTALTFVIFLML